MIMEAGPMVKLVLLTLLVFSIFSWAIIIYKLILLRRIEKETGSFYDFFWQKSSLSQVFSEGKSYGATPLARLFTAVYSEISGTVEPAGKPGPRGMDRENMGRIQRILKKTSAVEAAKLEYAVSFLATTGNTAPFIGLFGTVWGIMASFRNIGALGTANLAIVAPGISEALVATAMGLLVAIPAVVGYNHIVSRIARISSEMENFSSDLINIIEKKTSG